MQFLCQEQPKSKGICHLAEKTLLYFILWDIADYDIIKDCISAGSGTAIRELGTRMVTEKSDAIYPEPILNTLVPQTGQTPCVAGLPFFIVIFFASLMSLFALHLTQ